MPGKILAADDTLGAMANCFEACRQNVGSLADSEGQLPNAPARKRTVQHEGGAPGLDRTADTRFRNRLACRDFLRIEANCMKPRDTASEPEHAASRPLVCPEVCFARGAVFWPWPGRPTLT
jgi:hypothetical protein